ncbi:MAG: hypothetical protein R2939_17610 [Kofleriaceae bacterium]
MLFAEGQIAIGACWMKSRALLERRFRMHTADRVGMVFDTAFAAAEAGRKTGYATVYLVSRGAITPKGGARWPAPVALVLAEDEFIRIRRGSPSTFRFDGERCTLVDVRLALADVSAPVGLAHGPRAVGDATWAAVAALQACVDEVAARAAAAALLDALAVDGLVVPGIAGSICAEESERVQLLWRSLADRYANLHVNASLDQLKAEMGVTLRQLRRDVGEIASSFGLTGDGLKDVIRVLRLRTAATFLSAADATLERVAALVGYAGVDAMDRALRDAGLPRAAEVRAALLRPQAS